MLMMLVVCAPKQTSSMASATAPLPAVPRSPTYARHSLVVSVPVSTLSPVTRTAEDSSRLNTGLTFGATTAPAAPSTTAAPTTPTPTPTPEATTPATTTTSTTSSTSISASSVSETAQQTSTSASVSTTASATAESTVSTCRGIVLALLTGEYSPPPLQLKHPRHRRLMLASRPAQPRRKRLRAVLRIRACLRLLSSVSASALELPSLPLRALSFAFFFATGSADPASIRISRSQSRSLGRAGHMPAPTTGLSRSITTTLSCPPTGTRTWCRVRNRERWCDFGVRHIHLT